MPQKTLTPYHKQNVTLPIKSGHQGWATKSLAERYEGAVYHFLRTPKGSLYSDPEYGTTFYKKRGQGITITDIEIWRVELAAGFTTYLPDLEFNDINVEMDAENETLTVSVIWRVRGATDAMHGKMAETQKTTVLI